MVRLNHFISHCITAFAIMVLSILCLFDSTPTVELIANITYIIFLSVYAACSFKINISSIGAAGYLIFKYVGDFYNGGSEGHFTNEADGVLIMLLTVLSIAYILPLLAMVIRGYIKEKFLSILYIIVIVVVYFLGFIVVSLYFENKIIYYVGGILGSIVYIIATYYISKFSLKDLLDSY